jgi:hypothetical protein
MRGQRVIARTYGDRPAVLLVWDWGPRSIYLTDENYITIMAAGNALHMAVGFPHADVYECDETVVAEALTRPVWDPDKWDRMNRLSPVSAATILKQ